MITNDAYKNGISGIKAEKGTGDGVYEVKRVIDVRKNNKFINEFLKRQKKGKN